VKNTILREKVLVRNLLFERYTMALMSAGNYTNVINASASVIFVKESSSVTKHYQKFLIPKMTSK
jgi:hypothetical protein